MLRIRSEYVVDLVPHCDVIALDELYEILRLEEALFLSTQKDTKLILLKVVKRIENWGKVLV